MKDFLKRIKADFLVSSILCIVLGLIFIICNDGVINLMGSVFAVILIIIGAVYVGSFFSEFYYERHVCTYGCDHTCRGNLVPCPAGSDCQSDSDCHWSCAFVSWLSCNQGDNRSKEVRI